MRKLSPATRMLDESKDFADVCRELQVPEQTYCHWRSQFGGVKAHDPKRGKDLERQNSTLNVWVTTALRGCLTSPPRGGDD